MRNNPSPRTRYSVCCARNLVAGVLLVVLLVASGSASAATFSARERKEFRDYVTRTADTLVVHAEKREPGVTWINVAKDDSPAESMDFYRGTPGTSYFLLKAYGLTRDRRYLRTAEDGLAYLRSRATQEGGGLSLDPVENGLFVGNGGPGYTFLYAYKITRNREYLRIAESFADRIIAKPDFGPRSSPDIISGAAGAGIFLLKLHSINKNRTYLDGALKLGDFLIERAEPQEHGVKWKTFDDNPAIDYYFVGFSHGPAGIGYYLERLYQVTKVQKYHDYAMKAQDYIESIAVHEKNYVKWYHEELARKTRFSSQWCHGAPGMNPFFLVMYQDTKDRRFLDWIEQNTNYLLDQGVNVRKNGSVCHGISGNLGSLLAVYQATRRPDYLVAVRDGIGILERSALHEPGGYSWTPPELKVDYGYMTGIAGIGDFFAWLASNGKRHMISGLGYGDDF